MNSSNIEVKTFTTAPFHINDGMDGMDIRIVENLEAWKQSKIYILSRDKFVTPSILNSIWYHIEQIDDPKVKYSEIYLKQDDLRVWVELGTLDTNTVSI